jgi:hypothetical protein
LNPRHLTAEHKAADWINVWSRRDDGRAYITLVTPKYVTGDVARHVRQYFSDRPAVAPRSGEYRTICHTGLGIDRQSNALFVAVETAQ